MASLLLPKYHLNKKKLTNMMELGSGSFSQEVPRIADWARSQLLPWTSTISFGSFEQELFFNAALNHYHKTAKVLMVYFYTHPKFPAQ